MVCDNRTSLARLRNNTLPLATAHLDLSAMDWDVVGSGSPATVAGWQSVYLSSNVPLGDPGHVKAGEVPSMLRVRLPTLRQGIANSAVALSLTVDTPRPPGSCGSLNESSSDGMLQVSLGAFGSFCRRGHYGDLQGFCHRCSAGQFYQSEEGKVGASSDCGCKFCGPGTYTPTAGATEASSCQKCPAGTQGDILAGYRACFCLEDHARMDRFGECTACHATPGLHCADDVRSLSSGYWWRFPSDASSRRYTALAANLALERGYDQQLHEDTGRGERRRAAPRMSADVTDLTAYHGSLPMPHKCPNKDACLGNLTADCAEGYMGPLCAVCEPDHTMIYGSCSRCYSVAATSGILAVICLGVVLAMVYAWGTNSQVACSVGNGAPATPRGRVMNKVKILIGFMQVVASVGVTFQAVRWPANFLRMVDKLQFMTLDILALISPSCLSQDVDVNFYYSVLFATALPVVIIGLTWMYYVIRRWRTSNLEFLRAACIRNSFFVLFLLYPGMAQQIFRLVQPCHKICSFDGEEDCESFLRSDYSIQCNTTRHNVYTILAWVIAVPLFVVAFPTLLSVELYRRRHVS